MGRTLIPLALVAFILTTTNGYASRARVEAAGGLEFLLEDDAAQLTPFRIGNPAGLVLLPRINRFDLSGQWRYEEFNRNTASGIERSIRRTFDTLPALTANDQLQYNGLLVFPTDRLALQVSASLYHQDDAYDFSGNLSDLNQQKGFARAAFDLGILQLGVEGRMRGADEDVAPGFLAPGLELVEGTVKTQQNTVTGGLLLQFPQKPGKDQTRIQVGGTYTLMPMSPEQRQEYLVFAAPVTLQAHYNTVYRVKDYAAYGPEAYLETPGKLQALLFVRVNSLSSTLEEDIPEAPIATHVPEHKAGEMSGLYAGAGFKAASKVGGTTDLKFGAFLSMSSVDSSQFAADGTRVLKDEPGDREMHLGMGLSSAESFSAGLQYSLRTESGDRTPTGGAALKHDVADQSFVLGGERWFNPRWAYRIGITSQLIENKGDLDYQADLFTAGPESRVFGSLLASGVGYKSPRLAADLRLHIGQAQVLTGSDDRFATVAGMLLSLTTFF